jgi:hypothetical protein
MKPFRIFIDGQELLNSTSANLSRRKDDLTGTLTAEIFMSHVPQRPVQVDAAVAREITAYVGNRLSFYGKIDTRRGKPVQNRNKQGQYQSGTQGDGGTFSGRLGASGYSVTLSARGSTKYLIDSSHQHPTGTMLKTTNKAVLEELIKPWGIKLDWQATVVDIPVARFNDGGRVLDELRAVANETCIFLYETRDGKLRAIDRPGTQMGDPLILGRNVLDFNASQSESRANSKIVVKGQRSDPKIFGRDAVNRIKVIQDNWVTSDIPLTIQFYGDATDENLERRGKFEADQRARQAKEVTIEAFGLLQESGEPWDVGILHYVEIPPEGIFEVMECTGVDYTIDAEGTLKTSITLGPPPSTSISGGSGALGSAGLLGQAIPGLLDALALGNARRQQLGVTTRPGDYPFSWGPANLAVDIGQIVQQVASNLLLQDVKQPPPDKIQDRA